MVQCYSFYGSLEVEFAIYCLSAKILLICSAMKTRFVNKFSAKLLTIIALVLALVGQSMAYATMSCAMSMSGNMNHDSHMQADAKMHHSNMDHNDMAHSGIDHSMMNHTDMGHALMKHDQMDHTQMDHNSGDESHCAGECQCPESGCHSFSCLSDSAVLSTSSFPANNIFALDQHNLDISLSSLYRPPIFA